MNTYAKQLKTLINSLISEISRCPGEFTTFDSNAFTRNSKWNLATMMKFILRFGSSNLGSEIGDFFHYKEGFPTVSSFVQQRKKLKYTAFEQLFHRFNSKNASVPKLFKGYRLFAIDGSDIILPYNPKESNCLEKKHISKIHLNGLFDLLSKIYVDAFVEKNLEKNENAAGCAIIDRLDDKYPAIITADRNYENYNFFAHIEERGFDYIVRIKDINSTGILSGMELPAQDTFDVTVQIFLEGNHSLKTKLMPQKYKYVAKKKRFDYRDNGSYEMLIRLVRFKLTDNTYECLATSLSEEIFSAEELKEVYRRRLGIETAFRELKHIMGLSAFHSKQENSILQEVYARLIMYNFSMFITGKIQLKEKNLKNKLQINYTQAIQICRHFFNCLDFEVKYDVEATIQRFLLPVRPNRQYSRTAPKPNTKNFNYRLA